MGLLEANRRGVQGKVHEPTRTGERVPPQVRVSRQAIEVPRPPRGAKSQRTIGMDLAERERVVGSDGSLTGYAGGLERKRALLRLEGACA